ncbi:MAG TPA: hypothetical protein VF488_03060 [Gemmatimonadaceae bacterium]
MPHATHAPDVAPALPGNPAMPAAPALPGAPAIAPVGPVAAFPPADQQITFTTAPAPDPWEESIRELVFSDGFQIASFALLFPFAVALARRVWVRNGPRPVAPDLENSPRLQRIEQAIESIALEVERIGEAQRFTTRVLAEREPVAGRIPSASTGRREPPGVITPH